MEWISVNEQLPPADVIVAGVLTWSYLDGSVKRQTCCALLRQGTRRWTAYRWLINGAPSVGDDLTHWMPLPEVPK